MKIAIVGSGISGLTAAYYLSPFHDVTIFEASSYIGGHTNTVEFELDDRTYAIDTGFIVFNDRTYPNFTRLLDKLGVQSQNTQMSFSVSCEQSGLEYRGADFNGLFAQRQNLLRLKFLKLLVELVRFNKQSAYLLNGDNEKMTVGEFFQRSGYSQYFLEKYFLPMASAIWSCPHDTVMDFPIRFIVEFYRNHGLLNIKDRPQWKVIKGGSKQYVPELTKSFADRIKLQTPAKSVKRSVDSGVIVEAGSEFLHFDHIVFACHSDQALKILAEGTTPAEREILSEFPYEENIAVLHTDESVLPKSRRAWACWNYHVHKDESEKATVTYNMNMLQGLKSEHTFCVSLNCEDRISPEKTIRRIRYSHPTFKVGREHYQRRQHELIGSNRTSFCGAYWGNGFHEDGVKSAIAVAETLNQLFQGN